MSKWKHYRQNGTTQMRPYVPGEDLSGISVPMGSEPESDRGMIARNPDNHDDQWYVARAYFESNFIALDETGRSLGI